MTRAEQMKFAGRALSILAEMQDAMDDAVRALEHDDIYKTRACMAMITVHADEMLNLLARSKDDGIPQ
jgi:hypothetical protein